MCLSLKQISFLVDERTWQIPCAKLKLGLLANFAIIDRKLLSKPTNHNSICCKDSFLIFLQALDARYLLVLPMGLKSVWTNYLSRINSAVVCFHSAIRMSHLLSLVLIARIRRPTTSTCFFLYLLLAFNMVVICRNTLIAKPAQIGDSYSHSITQYYDTSFLLSTLFILLMYSTEYSISTS